MSDSPRHSTWFVAGAKFGNLQFSEPRYQTLDSEKPPPLPSPPLPGAKCASFQGGQVPKGQSLLATASILSHHGQDPPRLDGLWLMGLEGTVELQPGRKNPALVSCKETPGPEVWTVWALVVWCPMHVAGHRVVSRIAKLLTSAKWHDDGQNTKRPPRHRHVEILEHLLERRRLALQVETCQKTNPAAPFRDQATRRSHVNRTEERMHSSLRFHASLAAGRLVIC